MYGSTVARTQAGTFFFSYCTLCKCFFPSGRRVGERLYWNRHFRDELLWRDSWREGGGRPDMQGDPGRLGGVLVAYVR